MCVCVLADGPLHQSPVNHQKSPINLQKSPVNPRQSTINPVVLLNKADILGAPPYLALMTIPTVARPRTLQREIHRALWLLFRAQLRMYMALLQIYMTLLPKEGYTVNAPRYSAFMTIPKVPRPRTSIGAPSAVPKSSSSLLQCVAVC